MLNEASNDDLTPVFSDNLETVEAAASLFSEKDTETLNQAFPMLKRMHDEEGYVGATLPSSDDSQYAGEVVIVAPFYMNHTDPHELGVWLVEHGDKFKARLSTVAAPDGVAYKASIKDENGKYRDASGAESHEVAEVLGFVQKRFTQDNSDVPSQPTAAEKHRRFHLPRLGGHIIRQA